MENQIYEDPEKRDTCVCMSEEKGYVKFNVSSVL